MVYSITGRELRDYAYERLILPPLPGMFQQVLSAKPLHDSSIHIHSLVRNKVNNLLMGFSYSPGIEKDLVEIYLNPNRPGLDERDVNRFLEQLVLSDKIFEGGFPLCPRTSELRGSLNEAKRIFKRIDGSNDSKIICEVIEPNVGPEKIKMLVYNYMFREGLFYLFRMGDFSK